MGSIYRGFVMLYFSNHETNQMKAIILKKTYFNEFMHVLSCPIIFQAVILDATRLESSLSQLEQRGRQDLPEGDVEVANMLTTVTAMATKARALTADAEQHKKKLQVSLIEYFIINNFSAFKMQVSSTILV